MNRSETQEAIANGKTVLGVEFGSTRIKAVLIGGDHAPLASGSYDWENRYENGVWTYHLEDVWTGLQESYRKLSREVLDQYDVPLKTVGAIGFSGMMHGYLAFDKDGNLLAPFRTWRNTMTGQAAEALTELFQFNIPQRWSIAHLYQAILNHEPHVKDISHQTTLAGYVHEKLTGQKVLGIGEASGMFPIDSTTNTYDERMIGLFNQRLAAEGMPWKIQAILPRVLVAGENAGLLTAEGARLIDPTGQLPAGIPLCPPEGDAGTGMVATNSVAVRTGNVSAGTSVFAMIVLEKALSQLYPEIDMVTTPAGKPVAMVHSNNCTSELNAWVELFEEFTTALGVEVSQSRLFEMLYRRALTGDADAGGLLAYPYLSGEHITHFEEGRPLFVRRPDSRFTLSNFMRVHLFSALGALRIGLDILF
ncbi:MAG TPA: FGGY-family carbohydrate kinase, partial [Anaerolineae bacterium]